MDYHKRLLKYAYTTLFAIITFGAVTSHAGLISHWTFDESGGTIAADTTGSFNGTLSGGATFVPGGIAGNAISLNAESNSLVNMGYSFPRFAHGDFSIQAWINTTMLTPGIIYGKHESGFQEGFLLEVNSDGFVSQPNKVGFFASSNFTGPTSTTSVNDGLWHQVVVVYHAGGVNEIYVDGSVEDSRPSTNIIGISAPFLIGGVNVHGVPTASYTGLVDDVQVYGNALSSGDVQYLFNNPGLVAAIPEPETYAMLLAGLSLLGFMARRRKDSAA